MPESSSATPTSNSRVLYARLLGYVKPYRWAFIGSILAMALSGAAQGLFAKYLEIMIKNLFQQDDGVIKALAAYQIHIGHDTLAILVSLGIVLLFFVSGVSSLIGGYGMQWVGNKIMLDVRNQMFQTLLRLPVPYYDTHTTGTLMSKITNDVVGLQAAATSTLNALVTGLMTLVILLATMFHTSWKLTLIIFMTVPLLALVINAFSSRLRKISRESQRANAGITDVLEEAISSYRVIKIFGAQSYEAQRFFSASNHIRKLNMKQSFAAAASSPFTHLLVSSAIALIVYLASSNILGEPMSVAVFVAYIVAAAALVPQIKALAGVNEQIQRGLAAAESVFGLIDAEPEKDSGATVLQRASGALVFENVSLHYANKPEPALDQVSVQIAPGETIALVGPSGGGKTSFINLIPRFFTPTSGRITLDGQDLHDITLTSLREQIALVSQDVVLFNDTVAANIAYGKEEGMTREKIMAAAEAANAMDFIRQLPEGLDTVIGENGSRLSGGQRQRIAIARALLKDAPILLLDEATSALDSESERAVQTALERLMQGRTTLVVAHRLSTIENADRILVLERGRIVESGDHASLLKRGGLYAGLHGLQFSGQ